MITDAGAPKTYVTVSVPSTTELVIVASTVTTGLSDIATSCKDRIPGVLVPGAAEQVPVAHHAAAHAGAEHQHDDVRCPLAFAEEKFADGRGVGVVLHLDGELERLGELIAQGELGQVRNVRAQRDHAVAVIDQARASDAHAHRRLRRGGDQQPRGFGDAQDEIRRAVCAKRTGRDCLAY